MLTREDLKNLTQIDSAGWPVISFYLQINRKQVGEENYSRMVRNFIRDAEDKAQSMDEAQAQAVREDLKKIESLSTNERVNGSHSLGVIASSGAGISNVFRLPEISESSLVIDQTAHLRPLFQSLDKMYRYCVLLVNKEKARIFAVSMGEITDYSEVVDTNLPRKQNQGGWSQARFQRHHDDHVLHHVKRAAEAAFELFQKEGFDRLITGGTEEAATLLPDLLHSYLKERLAGTVSLDVDTTTNEIMDAIMAIDRRLKEENERQAVIALKDTLGAKGPAVAGVEATLRALEQGQVLNLVLAGDLKLEGSLCSGCGVYTTEPEHACSACGGVAEPVSDLVEEMLAQTIRQDGDIEFVYGEDTRAEMSNFGFVGALLRYSVTT